MNSLIHLEREIEDSEARFAGINRYPPPIRWEQRRDCKKKRYLETHLKILEELYGLEKRIRELTPEADRPNIRTPADYRLVSRYPRLWRARSDREELEQPIEMYAAIKSSRPSLPRVVCELITLWACPGKCPTIQCYRERSVRDEASGCCSKCKREWVFPDLAVVQRRIRHSDNTQRLADAEEKRDFSHFFAIDVAPEGEEVASSNGTSEDEKAASSDVTSEDTSISELSQA